MKHQTDKPLKDRLKEEMKRRGVKIPQLEKETGIPKDRMYKWYQSDNSPKYEDAIILEKWIKGDEKAEVGTNKAEPVRELEFVKMQPQEDKYYPFLAKNSNNSEKLDTLLLLMQQQSRELKGLSHKLNELEQQQIVTAAIQTSYQEYLVSKLDSSSDPESTVVEMQRNAFEKLTRNAPTRNRSEVSSAHK